MQMNGTGRLRTQDPTAHCACPLWSDSFARSLAATGGGVHSLHTDEPRFCLCVN
jgi:hypothetical protein